LPAQDITVKTTQTTQTTFPVQHLLFLVPVGALRQVTAAVWNVFWRNLPPHHKFQDEVTKFYQNAGTHEPN
jgi:hypothetical protein